MEVKSWYNGYVFERSKVYNPWSINLYIANNCLVQPYWVNTGSPVFLKDLLKQHNALDILSSLLTRDSTVITLQHNSPLYIFIMAGYLNITRKDKQSLITSTCEVVIPNKELRTAITGALCRHLEHTKAIPQDTSQEIRNSFFNRDYLSLQSAISSYLENAISYYDAGSEAFYQGLVLGLISLLDTYYTIKSNRESGDGRYDICLYPKDTSFPGIIMELKWKKKLRDDALESLAIEALTQINTLRYDAELHEKGIKDIIKLGIAFSGKNVMIKSN